MNPLKPLPPPGPPQSGRGLGIPLAVNIGVLLLLNYLSRWKGAGTDLALFLVFFQFFINGALMLGAFASKAPRWGAGFLLSGLLVLLVGMGMCSSAASR